MLETASSFALENASYPRSQKYYFPSKGNNKCKFQRHANYQV